MSSGILQLVRVNIHSFNKYLLNWMAGTVPSLGDILRTLPQGDRSWGTYISILGATYSEQYTIQDMVSGI